MYILLNLFQVLSELQHFEERRVHRVTSTLKFMGTDRISLTGSDNRLLWQDRGLYTCHARSEVENEGHVVTAEDESSMSLKINGVGRD